MRKPKKYHYIYKTTNLIRDYFYIGMHSTNNLEDGYLGSGKRIRYSIRKYGIENHKFEILEFLPSREELKIREKEIVNEEMLANPQCINLRIGGEGGGGWDHVNNNILIKQKSQEKSKKTQQELFSNNADWVIKRSKNISKSLKLSYERGTKIAPGWSENARKNANSELANEKRKETFEKIGHQQGEKNSRFGKTFIWMNKNKNLVQVDPLDTEKINSLINDGWAKGIKEKKIKNTLSYLQELHIKRDEFKQLILNCNVDVTKPKWAVILSDKLGKSRNSIKKFIKTYMPELWDICFIDVSMKRYKVNDVRETSGLVMNQ